MPLSSNSLFHYTSDLEKLKSILSFNFFPRLSVENLNDVTGKTIAFPMVCFCDIPLSQISNHVSKYGSYAIGLTKSWGIANGLSPIFYVHDQSLTAVALRGVHRIMTSNIKDLDWRSAILDFLHILPFIKSYESKINDRVVRFYDEREWRFVPDMAMLYQRKLEVSLFTSEELFVNSAYRDSINERLNKCPLVFAPSDITYIIVNSEDERIDIYDHIIRTKRAGFPYESLQTLTTKILTMDQIRNDF